MISACRDGGERGKMSPDDARHRCTTPSTGGGAHTRCRRHWSCPRSKAICSCRAMRAAAPPVSLFTLVCCGMQLLHAAGALSMAGCGLLECDVPHFWPASLLHKILCLSLSLSLSLSLCLSWYVFCWHSRPPLSSTLSVTCACYMCYFRCIIRVHCVDHRLATPCQCHVSVAAYQDCTPLKTH
jgi:hypothetical protein